jgi:hypothetical protein
LIPTDADLCVDPDAATQLNRPRPDPDWLAALIRRAQRTMADQPQQSRALTMLATAGYSRYDAPPDRAAAAAAWRLAIAHDFRQRDMAALWRLRHLRRLIDNANPVLLTAYIDVAIVLRAHGYLRPAKRLLRSVLSSARGVSLPTDDRGRLVLDALAAFGTTTPWSTSNDPPKEFLVDFRTSTRRVDELLNLRPIADGAFLDTHYRRLLMTAHIEEGLAARAEQRNYRPSHRIERLADQLRSTLSTAHPHGAVMGWFTLARVAFDSSDRDEFAESLGQARSLLAGPLRHYDFGTERAGFIHQAQQQGWTVPQL